MRAPLPSPAPPRAAPRSLLRTANTTTTRHNPRLRLHVHVARSKEPYIIVRLGHRPSAIGLGPAGAVRAYEYTRARRGPIADTPETVNMPATPEPVVQKDSQQTEIGTPDQTTWEDSQNTQFQSQSDPDTPEELFSPMDEQQMWAMINGPQ